MFVYMFVYGCVMSGIPERQSPIRNYLLCKVQSQNIGKVHFANTLSFTQLHRI